MAGQASEGGITIRRSLVRNLVLLIAFTAAAVLGLTIVQSLRAVEELSQSLVRRSTGQVETELDGFFTPVRRQLRTMADWGEAGMITPIAPSRLTPLFIPILRRQPHVSSLVASDPGGHGYMLLQQSEHYRRREVWRDRWARTARWAELSRRGSLERRWTEEIDYEPRDRPWFHAAVAAEGEVAWTAPYTFFTTRDPGITASMTFEPPGEAPHVVGLDVLLTDISDFTGELTVSDHGSALVLADDGRVVGLPSDRRWREAEARREAVLSPLEELELGPATTAHRRWEELGGGDRVFAIDADGERWWVGMRRFALSPERSFWVEVLVPERDFLGHVNRQRNVIIGVVAVALLLAVLMALWLARSYSRPLEALAARAERIRTLDLSESEALPSRLKEVRELTTAQERMRAALESFSRYVPIEVVRELIRRGEVAKLGGRDARLSVLFSDIAGFTSISERMTPTELTEHMGEYFDALLPILADAGGTVDKLIGDAIMCFFGAPIDDDDHARHALDGVLQCREALAELDAGWVSEGLPPLPTRFGLHTGDVVVGNIGSHERLSYTVLGDTVNLASRLEGACKVYGVYTLASADFKAAVGEGYEWRLLDDVAVKGKERSVEVFEPLGREGEVDEVTLADARRYEKAFEAYRARRFAEAIELLGSLDDGAATRLRTRCEALDGEALLDDWSPVTRLGEK